MSKENNTIAPTPWSKQKLNIPVSSPENKKKRGNEWSKTLIFSKEQFDDITKAHESLPRKSNIDKAMYQYLIRCIMEVVGKDLEKAQKIADLIKGA